MCLLVVCCLIKKDTGSEKSLMLWIPMGKVSIWLFFLLALLYVAAVGFNLDILKNYFSLISSVNDQNIILYMTWREITECNSVTVRIIILRALSLAIDVTILTLFMISLIGYLLSPRCKASGDKIDDHEESQVQVLNGKNLISMECIIIIVRTQNHSGLTQNKLKCGYIYIIML